MPDATVKRNDVWPPMRFACADSDGLVDLTLADSIKFLAKSGATLITGAAEPIDPPDSDGFNGQYIWAAGDTVTPGDYEVEIEVTWDGGASPPQVETFPNAGKMSLKIEIDLG